VIGRADDLTGYECNAWARRKARECGLTPIQAHVLLILATYAGSDGKCWPSIRTIALDAGYKPRADGTCSAISEALHDLGPWHKHLKGEVRSKKKNGEVVRWAVDTEHGLDLVWTSQAGRGRPAVRELLITQDDRSKPSSTEEGSAEVPEVPAVAPVSLPSAPEDAQPSAPEDQKNQGNEPPSSPFSPVLLSENSQDTAPSQMTPSPMGDGSPLPDEGCQEEGTVTDFAAYFAITSGLVNRIGADGYSDDNDAEREQAA
jgi:hypothetical protein